MEYLKCIKIKQIVLKLHSFKGLNLFLLMILLLDIINIQIIWVLLIYRNNRKKSTCEWIMNK